MDGKQYFFKEGEVREGRFSLSHEGHECKYQVMETRACDLVVEEINRGSRLVNWNLHYFTEPEDTWNLNRDLLAHVLMCRNAPPHLERLFPLESDPEIAVAIHVGRIPEAYQPVILPSLCRVGKRASLIWGTKFAPLISKSAKRIVAWSDIKFDDARQIVTIEVCLLVLKMVEKHQAGDFDINRMAGYLKTSLKRACKRYVTQATEFKKRDPVRLGLKVKEDLEFEGSEVGDGVRLGIDPDSLKSYIFEHIEHPSTVITERLLALGHDVHYKMIQRLKRELVQTIEGLEDKPIPTFADMEAMGREKMDPKELKAPIPITGIFPYPKPKSKGILFDDLPEDEDLPEDVLVAIVQLVHENTKIAENEKN